jgi:hypothetical protein
MQELHCMERMLKVGRDGKLTDAKLTIGLPRLENGVWRCFWSLEYLQSGISMTGDDQIDSLVRVVRFLTKFIKDCQTDGWTIYWQQQGDNAGF